eukprot:Skav223107  [mRNA]  locus=scaffold419:720976:725769:+ [translate_table: standard]
MWCHVVPCGAMWCLVEGFAADALGHQSCRHGIARPDQDTAQVEEEGSREHPPPWLSIPVVHEAWQCHSVDSRPEALETRSTPSTKAWTPLPSPKAEAKEAKEVPEPPMESATDAMAALDVNTTWAEILERLSKGHVEEARALATELSQGSRRAAVAAGEIAVRLTACCKSQDLTALIKALRLIEATWSETVCLFSTENGKGPEKWTACAQLAKSCSLQSVLEHAKVLGLLWTERLTCPTAAELAGEMPDVIEEPETSSSDPKEQATLLLRAALKQLEQEPPQQKDALKDAKEALATFRNLQLPECEATALLAVSQSCVDFDMQEAFQAALQALKIFREQGHLKGEVSAMHQLARVDQARKSFDEASYKASEALKLARQMGDRARELALCETVLEVNTAQDRPDKALEAAKDAEVLAKIFENQTLLARSKCWIARAFGAYEERKMTGIKAAEEALQLYGMMNQKNGEVEALEALAIATKEDFSDVLSKSLILAEKFAEGDKKEEVRCLLVAASCEVKDTKKALELLERASSVAKGDRPLQGQVLLRRARLHLDREEPTEAMRAATQAGSIFRNEPYPTKKIRTAEIECVEIQMDAHVLLGARDEAFRLGLEQGRRFKGLRERQAEGMILMKLASLHQMRLEEEAAFKVMQYVPTIFNTVGDRQLEGLAWERIANSYLDAGDAMKASKAMEQCVGNFRKVNSRLMRARAALLQADVQTALVSIHEGSSLDALDAAREATELFQNNQPFLARAVQLLTNAHLLNGQAKEALERARESQDLARNQRQIGGEAFSLLMEAGAHLSLKDFGESQRCIRQAKDLFDSDYDESGLRSANDFATFVQKAEAGEEDPSLFRGFGFRRVNAKEQRQKAATKEMQPRRKQKTSDQSDIILWQVDGKSSGNPDGRCIMTYFEGFEVRAGVARQQQPMTVSKAPKEEEPVATKADYSKEYKDTVKQEGPPEREPAVFAVRWVQATEQKKDATRGRRELRRQEDTRVVCTKSLDAPSGCARYAKSDRLEAPGERHGYRVF